jgi:hypothetical protein
MTPIAFGFLARDTGPPVRLSLQRRLASVGPYGNNNIGDRTMRTAATRTAFGMMAILLIVNTAYSQVSVEKTKKQVSVEKTKKKKATTVFPLSVPITLNTKNMPLTAIGSDISQQTGITFRSDSAFSGWSFPALQVKDIPLRQVLELLGEMVPELNVMISAGQNFVSLELLNLEGWPQDGIIKRLGYRPGAKVIVFLKRKILPAGGKVVGALIQKPATRTCIYNLSTMLEEGSQSAQDVAAAMQAAWDAVKPMPQGKITFHEDTKLLMCTGTEEAIHMADQVIGQMPEGRRIVLQSIFFRQGDKTKEFRDALSAMVSADANDRKLDRRNAELLEKIKDLREQNRRMFAREGDKAKEVQAAVNKMAIAEANAKILDRRNAAMLEKIKALEEQNRQMAETLKVLKGQLGALTKKLSNRPAEKTK